ncbi:MAG: hypothetical protein FWE25_00085 [Lachnospiraceae bacterium]|nr:hypothetical protein [Lachnospiraceae bacterium]
MEQLTFGEQLKIVLKRKGLTIKGLAEVIEAKTGKRMSRQNLTQRIGRDNFQEQDMRMLADLLGCKFSLNILSVDMDMAVSALRENNSEAEHMKVIIKKQSEGKGTKEKASKKPVSEEPVVDTSVKKSKEKSKEEPETEVNEVDITIGQLYDMHEELDVVKEKTPEEQEADFRAHGVFLRREGAPVEPAEESKTKKKVAAPKKEEKAIKPEEAATEVLGDINPYTHKEYETNTVRSHPSRIGYVQVYDRTIHKWMDMTEWAFLGYQERKKALLGDRYEPPSYLD